MYINAAYLNDSLLNYKDTQNPLSIISCGNYKLINKNELPTFRPHGRLDYQLIYISAGRAYFYFEPSKEPTIVTAGSFVLFRPKEYQKYVYYASDCAEAFWIHFSGTAVKEILRNSGISDDMKVIKTGVKIGYSDIFKSIIDEIHKKNHCYIQMIDTYFRQLIIQIARDYITSNDNSSSFIKEEIDIAKKYFNENYSSEINIDEYASSRGMSVSWFIRNFKEISGFTPLQYILTQRIINAQILLESTSYTINEIASLVGYENQLYFSRIFSKQKGLSPKKYRELITSQTK